MRFQHYPGQNSLNDSGDRKKPAIQATTDMAQALHPAFPPLRSFSSRPLGRYAEDDMTPHISKTQLLVKLLVIGIGFTLAIAGCYIWLLPTYFNGAKTYSVLVIGEVGAFVVGGYRGFKSFGAPAGMKTYIVAMCYGFAVAIFVFCFSLLIMVNVVGS